MEQQKESSSSNNLVKIVVGLWVGVFVGIAIIAVLVFTGVIPLFSNAGGETTPQQAPTAGLESSGILLPEIALTDLEDNEVLPSDFRGKIVVMNFWATWCGPCIQEMPIFQEYQDHYQEIVVLGVNEEESAERVQEFQKEIALDYQFLLDKTGKMGHEFHINFLPTTIIADEAGEVRFRHYGVISREQMDHYLETLGITIK